MENKCCANCKYGSCNEMHDYVCVNDESEYLADFVEAGHSCIDYTPKDGETSEKDNS